MDTVYSVSQFVAVTNQILENAFPFVRIEGEVSNFRISQDKWVTFRLSDGEAIIECFMTVWSMRTPLEDGMQVVVSGNPALKGQWGKFSVTVQRVVPVGEGSLRRAFALLKNQLEKEGLFDASRKRSLPRYPQHIGVMSSAQADGYKDFVTIIGQRWPLAKISFAPSSVQGEKAPDELIDSLSRLNEMPNPPEVIALVRGGGSAEDLASFNDERLVRAIAASRAITVVGVGHENDITLSDLAADVRASTPTNAAEIISPSVNELFATFDQFQKQLSTITTSAKSYLDAQQAQLASSIQQLLGRTRETASMHERLINEINPQRQLERGYSLVMKSDKIISSLSSIEQKDFLTIRVSDGTFNTQVTGVIE